MTYLPQSEVTNQCVLQHTQTITVLEAETCVLPRLVCFCFNKMESHYLN